MAYQPLRYITSNPVSDAYNEGQSRRADQEAADLRNSLGQATLLRTVKMLPLEVKGAEEGLRGQRQTNDFNEQANPSRLSSIQSTADVDKTKAYVAGQTADADILTGLSNAKAASANAKVAAGTADARIAEAGANAATAGANAQVAQGTVGARIDAAKAQAAVAQNGAQYDKEGRWFDLFSKNPQLALTRAAEFGVPQEVVAAAQDQNTAAWLSQAWKTVETQYPGDQNAAMRAAVFEQMVEAAGANPSASSAMAVPSGSPAPKTRQDELREMAQQLGLKVGTQDYVNFMGSDGKTLPGDRKIITLYDTGGMPKSLYEDDPAVSQMLKDGWTAAAPKSGKVMTQTGVDDKGNPIFEFQDPAPKLTEDQSKAMNFAARMGASEPTISELEQQGTDWWARAKQQYGGDLANYLQSPDYQRFWQAKEDFMRAVLRKESGAVISQEEMAGGDKQYFPQPGDGPDVIKQKQQNRRVALEAMKTAAGPGASLIPGIIDRAKSQPAPQGGPPNQKQSAAPQPPAALADRPLQWSPSREQWRDKDTGEIFDKNGFQVQ